MDNQLKKNIKKLNNIFNELDSWQFPTNYNIKEIFTKGNRTYKTINLTFEKEKGILIFSDIGDQMQNNIYNVLNMFLVDSIINLQFNSIKPLDLIFTFKDGIIQIQQEQ
jgi:hypothetical protein